MSHFASGMIGAVSNLSDGPAPTLVSVSANGSGTSAAMPSGWAVGDLLMIFANSYRSGDTCQGHSTPAGWTVLGDWTHKRHDINYRTRTKVFYRIAQSGDSTVSLGVLDASTRLNSCMAAFRGVDVSSPFEALETVSDQSVATALPYARIVTLGSNRVVVQAFSNWSSTAIISSTPDAGWTELCDLGSAIGVAADMRVFASAGLTSAGNQTRNLSGVWGRLAVAIKPA